LISKIKNAIYADRNDFTKQRYLYKRGTKTGGRLPVFVLFYILALDKSRVLYYTHTWKKEA
jgi:hypothetical protein